MGENRVGHAHSVREELHGILAFVGVIWAVYLVDWLGGSVIELNQYGLRPRNLYGLVGVVTMPFLHGNFSHLIGNTIPLFVLLALLAGSRASSWLIVGLIVLLGDSLLWLFSFNGDAVHVGASGLIYGLATFLVLAGLLERRVLSLFIALLVGFLFGTSMLAGLVPKTGVSWDGHLYGAIAGALVAYGLLGAKDASSSGRSPGADAITDV